MKRARLSGALALAVVATGLTLPVSSAVAVGADLYVEGVSAACSNSGPGTAAQPYCSLQAAADAAQPGATVHVSTGQYGALSLTHSGSAGAPITIAEDGGSAIIGAVSLNGVHDVDLVSLNLGAVTVTSSTDVTLDQDHVMGGSAVEVGGASERITVTRSLLQSSGGPAVQVDPGAQDVLLTTNLVYGVHGPAVVIHGASGTDVVSNSIAFASVPVQVDQSASGTVLENNDVDGPITVSADAAGSTTSDYNVEYSVGAAPLYSWAGTDYRDLPSFRTATREGAHDLAGGAVNTNNDAAYPGSWDIDSADANAPGELSTDYFGRPRVDDPLVANTGTGPGYYDRGALESQDGWAGSAPLVSPQQVAYGSTVTFTADDANPWQDAVTRTYDFGDGTPQVTTTDDVVHHTYGAVPGGGTKHYTVTVTEVTPVNGRSAQNTTWVEVSPPGPLTVSPPRLTVPDTTAPLRVMFGYADIQTPFSVTSCSVDFGDGTKPVNGCVNVQHEYPRPGIYHAKVTVNDAAGRTASASSTVDVGPEFVRTMPSTAVDTYRGIGAARGAVGSDRTLRLKVSGRYGVPVNATSVLLNVGAVGAGQAGSVTAYAAGSPRPSQPTLFYPARQARSSLVEVPIDSTGYVDLANLSGKSYLSVEVEGYETTNPDSANGLEFVAGGVQGEGAHWGPTVGPSRIGPGKTIRLATYGAYQLNTPPDERPLFAVVNVMTQYATAFSRLTFQGGSGAAPGAESVYAYPGQLHGTTLLVPLAPDGSFTVHNTAGSTTVSVWVEGYYLPAPGAGALHALIPNRSTPVFDTRTGLGGHHGALPYEGTVWIKVAGLAGVPSEATEVAVRLGAVNVRLGGVVDEQRAYATVLGTATGQPVADLVYLPVVNGYIKVTSYLENPADFTASVEGYAVN